MNVPTIAQVLEGLRAFYGPVTTPDLVRHLLDGSCPSMYELQHIRSKVTSRLNRLQHQGYAVKRGVALWEAVR